MAKIITYDLRAPGRDYSKLYEYIKSFSSYAKVTESCYIVETSLSSKQIRDNLKELTDANDRLFVAKLTGEAAWVRAIDGSDKVKSVL